MPVGLVEEEVIESAQAVVGNIQWVMYVQLIL